MTLGLLAVTLLVFNGTGVYLYVHFKASKEEELGRHLTTLAQWATTEIELELAALFLSTDEIAWLDEQTLEEHGALLDQMQRFVTAHDLERLLIYDADLRVKVDTAERIAIDAENPHAVVDSLWIPDALSGETVATVGYQVADNPLMRAYAPLLAAEGEVVGLVSVEGQRHYFAPLGRVRQLMLLTTLVVSGALIAIALVAHQALRRFVRLEEAVAHTDRLQALGTLAAGMAHEIRNPLGIIRVTAETLRDEMRADAGADNPDRLALCADILEEVDRVHDLIGRFLNFARPAGAGSEEPAEVAAVVRHAARLCAKAAAGHRINVEVDVATGLEDVRTPLAAASLQQVLFNLLRNAQEAVAAAGKWDSVRVALSPGADAATIRIAVRDRGVGMSPDITRRATEPFVTTKPEGTGLGLAISRNLLADVQGRLEFDSEPGVGTAVTVILPTLREESES